MEREYGELYLPPETPKRNAVNGRFLPGHVPHNKGKKMSEYMGERALERVMKHWNNFTLYRPRTRPDVSKSRKEIIAVKADGSWLHFSHAEKAVEWIGGASENVRRCCRDNQRRHVNQKTGKINTDHTCKGVRFYFESDSIWTKKIR